MKSVGTFVDVTDLISKVGFSILELKVNQSRSRFGKIYNPVFLIVKIQKNGGKFEFILLKILGCKFLQNGTSNNLALIFDHAKFMFARSIKRDFVLHGKLLRITFKHRFTSL